MHIRLIFFKITKGPQLRGPFVFILELTSHIIDDLKIIVCINKEDLDMYIAIEMKKLLEEKATVDAKAMANVPLKVFCKPEDPMNVADHMWLNELKAIEYKDAMRSGNEVLDAGMTAGTLLGENSDGVYVTDLETLLLSGNASNGKVTVTFANSLKDAFEAYKKAEKVPVRRTRKPKAEVAPVTPDESMQKPFEKTETVSDEDIPAASTATTSDGANSFPMPEPQQDRSETGIETEETAQIANNNVEEPPFSFQDIPNEGNMKQETTFPLKDQHDRSHARRFDESGVPDGPEYDQFKKAAISCGISSANVPYALAAMQVSDTVEDLLHSLVMVFCDYKSEAYTVNDTLKRHFNELKPLADQVEPFEI